MISVNTLTRDHYQSILSKVDTLETLSACSTVSHLWNKLTINMPFWKKGEIYKKYGIESEIIHQLFARPETPKTATKNELLTALKTYGEHSEYYLDLVNARPRTMIDTIISSLP